jgi:hypothetical protein
LPCDTVILPVPAVCINQLLSNIVHHPVDIVPDVDAANFVIAAYPVKSVSLHVIFPAEPACAVILEFHFK